MFKSLTRSALLLALCLALASCAESPEERLEATWLAAEDERFEDFMAHFSEASSSLIRGLATTRARTKRAFGYVDTPYDLVPRGEIVNVEQREALMVVTIKADERYTLRMVSEGGKWVIDGLSLSSLWAPLKGGEEG